MSTCKAPQGKMTVLEARKPGQDLAVNHPLYTPGKSNSDKLVRVHGAGKTKGVAEKAQNILKDFYLVAKKIQPPCSNTNQDYPNRHTSKDEWLRLGDISERKAAAKRSQSATRMLEQAMTSGPTGGYSPLARRILSSSQSKVQPRKGPKTCQGGSRQTSNLRQSLSYTDSSSSSRTHDGGNRGAGYTPPPQQRTGPNPATRRSKITGLTGIPDVAGVTEKEPPRVALAGADVPTSNTLIPAAASPTQRKRKRGVEDDSTLEEPPRKRRCVTSLERR